MACLRQGPRRDLSGDDGGPLKLYEGYTKKANECRGILKEFDYSEIEGNQVYSPLRAVSVDYTFALLAFKNHDLYFGHLGGEGGDPKGPFADLVENEYPGGVEMWKQAVRKAASAARGWVMVGYDLNDGSIFNYVMDTQNLWAVYNMVPVLALDVYEHAYTRDYGATPDGRKQYVDAFFRSVDWDHVNRQLLQAQVGQAGCGLDTGARAGPGRRVRRALPPLRRIGPRAGPVAPGPRPSPERVS